MNYTTDQIQSAMERADVPLHLIFCTMNHLAKFDLTAVCTEEFAPLTRHDILEKICEVENVDINEVMGANQDQKLVKVRVAFCAIAKEYFCQLYTLKQIGRSIGNDHSTVSHNLKAAKELPWRVKEVAEIKAKIKIKCG